MKLITIIGFLGCVPVLYAIGQIKEGQTGLLLLCLVLGGFFVNFPWGVLQAYPSLRYPKEVVGRAMGITNGIGQFGSFVSPLISGYLVISLPDASYDFSRVFIFWSMLALFAVGAAAFLKETQIDCSRFIVDQG